MTALMAAKEPLEAFLAQQAGAASARLIETQALSGGAIQENWRLEVEFQGGPHAGSQVLVLRTDAAKGLASSLTRPQEFAVQRVAWQAGVSVPEPLWLCEDTAILGKVFTVMRHAAGTALARRIVKDTTLGGDRPALAARLGRELAKIHGIVPPHPDLEFLGPPPGDPVQEAVTRCRKHLDVLAMPRPALEWGLRWCETRKLQAGDTVLTHQDFRTGNYMLDETGLTGILDWEFACWSDPMSDIGWFCAKCWRFGKNELEAGGIATREEFYRAYEAESGRRIDPERVALWEVMAHIRWAVVALQQGQRAQGWGEDVLDLALTGRIYPPSLEQEILVMSAPEKWNQTHG